LVDPGLRRDDEVGTAAGRASLDDALRPAVTTHRLDEDVLFDCALRQ
jgi:hypothetical protein